MTTCFSFTIFCVIGIWWGIELSGEHLHILVASGMITWFAGCGAGLLFGVGAAHFKEMEKVVGVIRMPLMFVSAVFVPLVALPQSIQDILIYNPLVHTIELSRKALFPFYNAGETNLTYPLFCAFILLSAGLIAFRLNRNFLTRR